MIVSGTCMDSSSDFNETCTKKKNYPPPGVSETPSLTAKKTLVEQNKKPPPNKDNTSETPYAKDAKKTVASSTEVCPVSTTQILESDQAGKVSPGGPATASLAKPVKVFTPAKSVVSHAGMSPAKRKLEELRRQGKFMRFAGSSSPTLGRQPSIDSPPLLFQPRMGDGSFPDTVGQESPQAAVDRAIKTMMDEYQVFRLLDTEIHWYDSMKPEYDNLCMKVLITSSNNATMFLQAQNMLKRQLKAQQQAAFYHEKEKATLNKQIDELKGKLNDSTHEISRLQRYSNSLQQQFDQEREEKMSAQSYATKLEEDLVAAKRAKLEDEKRFRTLQESHDKKVRELENLAQDRFNQIIHLNDRVAAATNDKEELELVNQGLLEESHELEAAAAYREHLSTREFAERKKGSIDWSDYKFVGGSLELMNVENIVTIPKYEFSMVNTEDKKGEEKEEELPLVAGSKKKLLVLDVNGILVDCTPKYKSKKTAIKRPGCDDFLWFCFSRFNVGVWSTSCDYNLDKVINSLFGEFRKKFLFCWNQSHCTQTKYNVVGTPNKPLFLKELKKLWEKLEPGLPWEKGEYDASNTVLVDDSPYKALRNPEYTAIFPSSFHHSDENNGSLCHLQTYLEGLAITDDVQSYIKKNQFGQQPSSCLTWMRYHNIINQEKWTPQEEEEKSLRGPAGSSFELLESRSEEHQPESADKFYNKGLSALEESSMACFSEDKTSGEETDFSDSDLDEYRQKYYEGLQEGKPAVKLPGKKFTCPYCPSRRKTQFDFNDLLQHASDIGISAKRPPKVKAEHLALEKYLRHDVHSDVPVKYDVHCRSKPGGDVRINYDKNEKYVWPWKGIVVNIPRECNDGKYTGESGAKFRDKLIEDGFNPIKVKMLWNGLDGFLGMAVVEFDSGLGGLRDAMGYEKAHEEKKHGKKEWKAARNDKKIGLYAWVAREEEYNLNNKIGSELRRTGNLKTISELESQGTGLNVKI